MFGLVGWFCFVCLVWFGKKMFCGLLSPHSAMIKLGYVEGLQYCFIFLYLFFLKSLFLKSVCCTALGGKGCEVRGIKDYGLSPSPHPTSPHRRAIVARCVLKNAINQLCVPPGVFENKRKSVLKTTKKLSCFCSFDYHLVVWCFVTVAPL